MGIGRQGSAIRDAFDSCLQTKPALRMAAAVTGKRKVQCRCRQARLSLLATSQQTFTPKIELAILPIQSSSSDRIDSGSETSPSHCAASNQIQQKRRSL